MSQQEINEQIYEILKCLVHSTDKYERDVVDLSTNAFVIKLGKMIRSSASTLNKEEEE